MLLFKYLGYLKTRNRKGVNGFISLTKPRNMVYLKNDVICITDDVNKSSHHYNIYQMGTAPNANTLCKALCELIFEALQSFENCWYLFPLWSIEKHMIGFSSSFFKKTCFEKVVKLFVLIKVMIIETIMIIITRVIEIIMIIIVINSNSNICNNSNINNNNISANINPKTAGPHL